MRRRLALFMGPLLALLVIPGAANASVSPGWIVVCPYSHSQPDDPIGAPGAAGATHVHDFIGNNGTSATSTYQSMVSGSSTCGSSGDRAGYWIPALYRNGVQVKPAGSFGSHAVRQTIYYRADNLLAGTKVEPFPADMRIVAGNSHATSPTDSPKLGKEIYWGCSDNSTGKLPAPPSCATGIVSLHIGFPNCWDGTLSHVDDTVHLRYPSSGVCPAGFTRPIVRLIERFEYPVGTDSSGITLSSGATYTAHGDFWNTWDQATLARLTANCLNGSVICGNNPA